MEQPPMTDLLIPITDIEALKAAGIHHPATENAWRWCFRHRHIRGLEGRIQAQRASHRRRRECIQGSCQEWGRRALACGRLG